MTSCKDTYAFLSQVSAKQVTAPPSDADAALLAQYGLVQFFSEEEVRELGTSVQKLAEEQSAASAESLQRAGVAAQVSEDVRETHSVLFRLEGKQKKAAKAQRESTDEARLKAIDSDLQAKQRDLGQLLAQRSLLDTITSCGSRYVGLTGLGVAETRNLAVRLYRVSDTEFASYWQQSLKITQDLTDLATGGAGYFGRLSPVIALGERSHLWAIAIGLAKAQPDSAQGTAAFVQDYNSIESLSSNIENRLMAAEILFALPRPLPDEYSRLLEVLKTVQKLNVPKESALGVASILLLGERADGTLATDNLADYLRVTPSYEAAALLSIVNVSITDLTEKFHEVQRLFVAWGYGASEDVELASAYLAVSEVPVEGVSTKLAILAKGLSTYLQYPLVGAAVLASLSTLEANETLNLLEHAYDIVGRRTGPLTQAELICLAVRMLHGVRDELVGPLDTTATAAPAVARAAPGTYGPRFFFVPIIVAHNAYFSTYSGLGGPHPGHVHGFGGGAGGFVG